MFSMSKRPTYGPLARKHTGILHQLMEHKDEQGRATCIWPTEELIAEILEFGFEKGLAQYVKRQGWRHPLPPQPPLHG